jgi:hypothetical protein
MAPTCTVTGTSGKKVSETTLAALLREEALPRIGGRQWFFCPDPECDVVYFTSDGETLSKDMLTVRVGLKESGPARPICYCFGHDFADVESEAAHSEESAIAADITEKCRQGLDRCEETNPQGSCCLGNVRRVFLEARRRRTPAVGDGGDSHDCCSSKPRKGGA